MDFTIGAIVIPLLIVAVVEAAKEFGVTGKASRALALGLGFLFGSLVYGIAENLIPAEYVPYIVWVVTSLASGLAAVGYYSFGKRFAGKIDAFLLK